MRKQELHPRTAIVNKQQKNSSKLARLTALRWLAETFPHAFDNSVQISPLKIGIMEDVLKHADKAVKAGISKSKLREAVVVFTRRIDYLTTLKAREMRIDLEGKPDAAVTEDEAEKAAAKIKRRVEKSAKNARKNISPRPAIANDSKPIYPSTYTPDYNAPTYYSDRGYDTDIGNNKVPTKTTKSAAVVVKHKTTRQYDPEAVARLKEKLGLSKSKALVE